MRGKGEQSHQTTRHNWPRECGGPGTWNPSRQVVRRAVQLPRLPVCSVATVDFVEVNDKKMPEFSINLQMKQYTQSNAWVKGEITTELESI